MSYPAVFLDRDGTIIEDAGYIDAPEKVRLLPGAARAVQTLRAAGFRVVIASNQSGVARGMFDEATLAAVHDRMEDLLQAEGAGLDGTYYCPFLDGPEAKVEAYRQDSELRKPNPGMLEQAARDLDIDLAHSWMIGDSPSDVAAGRRAGCRTILLQGGSRAELDPRPTHTVDTLVAAAELVLSEMTDKDVQPTGVTGRGSNEPESQSQELLRALDRIHDQLERAQRQQRQADFSVWRLFGALLQMFALVAALWGLIPLLNDQPAVAGARLLLACFFQLASITALAIDRFR